MAAVFLNASKFPRLIRRSVYTALIWVLLCVTSGMAGENTALDDLVDWVKQRRDTGAMYKYLGDVIDEVKEMRADSASDLEIAEFVNAVVANRLSGLTAFVDGDTATVAAHHTTSYYERLGFGKWRDMGCHSIPHTAIWAWENRMGACEEHSKLAYYILTRGGVKDVRLMNAGPDHMFVAIGLRKYADHDEIENMRRWPEDAVVLDALLGEVYNRQEAYESDWHGNNGKNKVSDPTNAQLQQELGAKHLIWNSETKQWEPKQPYVWHKKYGCVLPSPNPDDKLLLWNPHLEKWYPKPGYRWDETLERCVPIKGGAQTTASQPQDQNLAREDDNRKDPHVVPPDETGTNREGATLPQEQPPEPETPPDESPPDTGGGLPPRPPDLDDWDPNRIKQHYGADDVFRSPTSGEIHILKNGQWLRVVNVDESPDTATPAEDDWKGVDAWSSALGERERRRDNETAGNVAAHSARTGVLGIHPDAEPLLHESDERLASLEKNRRKQRRNKGRKHGDAGYTPPVSDDEFNRFAQSPTAEPAQNVQPTVATPRPPGPMASTPSSHDAQPPSTSVKSPAPPVQPKSVTFSGTWYISPHVMELKQSDRSVSGTVFFGPSKPEKVALLEGTINESGIVQGTWTWQGRHAVASKGGKFITRQPQPMTIKLKEGENWTSIWVSRTSRTYSGSDKPWWK